MDFDPLNPLGVLTAPFKLLIPHIGWTLLLGAILLCTPYIFYMVGETDKNGRPIEPYGSVKKWALRILPAVSFIYGLFMIISALSYSWLWIKGEPSAPTGALILLFVGGATLNVQIRKWLPWGVVMGLIAGYAVAVYLAPVIVSAGVGNPSTVFWVLTGVFAFIFGLILRYFEDWVRFIGGILSITPLALCIVGLMLIEAFLLALGGDLFTIIFGSVI